MWNPFAFARKPAPAAVLSGALADGKQFENALTREHARYMEQRDISRTLADLLTDEKATEARKLEASKQWLAEIAEAQAMGGAGPWAPSLTGAGDVPIVRLPVAVAESLGLTRVDKVELEEAGPVGDAPLGSWGMYELMLANVGWQREINYSWLEFSRWGIQQIVLICRLHYIKNPIARRLVDVIAQYVFARGFDITTEDEDANDEIKDFLRRNQKVLGHVAMTAQQRAKLTDGNLFWVFFTDEGTGKCDLRLIDATEIQEIRTDPDDADAPQYYQRMWTQRVYDPVTGTPSTKSMRAWYAAIDYDPPAGERLKAIGADPVLWDSPVYHRKIGTVGKWLFGCPPLYPAIDWIRESRHFLEVCMSVRQSLSQWASHVTTKGGQQAIEGWKQQMQTQAGPGNPLYDTNPAAGAGSTLVTGPGTTMEAFKVQGATFSPDDVRWYVIFCCMCLGMPPTFVGDMETSNLATATSLDRPTETVFLSIQEEWIEDLTLIVGYMLKRSITATGGKLYEAKRDAKTRVVAAQREIMTRPGGARYWGFREAKKSVAKPNADIEVRVQFPAIREGDIGVLIKAGVEAMTLDNKGGQVVGVDERAGCLWLMQALGYENADELIEKMYPSTGKDKYDPDRAKQKLAAPIMKLQDQPGTPKTPAQAQQTVDNPPAPTMKEAVTSAFDRLKEAVTVHLNGE
jgi:hypothetical protein